MVKTHSQDTWSRHKIDTLCQDWYSRQMVKSNGQDTWSRHKDEILGQDQWSR